MLAELAIGDAYGFGFEWADPEYVRLSNDGLRYHHHPKHPQHIPGAYSDDAELAIVVADFLTYDNVWNAPALWERIFKVTREPRAGYASGFRMVLDEAKTPQALAKRIVPLSEKAGGAMRAAACGALQSIGEAINMAMMQASLTHATRNGMTGAAGSAALVWACRQGCDRAYLPQFLEDLLPGFRFAEGWSGPVGNDALQVVKAAATALSADPESGLTEILKASVAFTGDVDTVASIAMAAGSMHPEIKNDLSLELYNKLEPQRQMSGAFAAHLREKSRTLLARFPKETPP
jgi:ADP-ribosylglycohydrolase